MKHIIIFKNFWIPFFRRKRNKNYRYWLNFSTYIHAVPSYKKRLYKKLLVDFCRHKKPKLVDILSAKKPYHKFLQFFSTIMLFFSKIFKLSIWNGHFFKNFKKQRLYKAEKLRNKVCIKLAKRWETQLVGIELCFL